MAQVISPVTVNITHFDLTQQLLVEQTLLRLYKNPLARLQLSAMIASSQLLPRELIKITTSFRRHRIIELGCGKGFLTHALALLCPGTEVIGIDANERAIQIARETQTQHPVSGLTGPVFIHSNFNNLEKLDADLIIVNTDSQLIQHQSLKQVLRQVQDWLEAGSDLIVKSDSAWLHHLKQFTGLLTPDKLKESLDRLSDLKLPLLPDFKSNTLQSQLTAQLGVQGFNLLNTFQTPLSPISGQKSPACYQFTYAEKPLQPKQLENLFELSMAAQSRPVEYKSASSQQQYASIPESVTLKSKPVQYPDLQPAETKPASSSNQSPIPDNRDETLSFIFSKDWKPLLQELNI